MAYFRCGNGNSGGGGGELTETLLWENSNTSRDWPTGYINLLDKFTNYKYLKVILKYTKADLVVDGSTTCEVMCDVEAFERKNSNGVSAWVYIGNKYYTRGVFYYFSGSSDTKETAYITSAFGVTDSIESNSYLIPYKIYGLK